MKTTCLLFLTMSCITLMPGTGYAAPSQQTAVDRSTNVNSAATDHSHDAEHAAPLDDGKGQKERNPSAEQRAPGRASDKSHPRGRTTVTVANRPKQLASSRRSFISASAANLHQRASNSSGAAAKGGFTRKEAVKSALTVRQTSIVRPTVALLNPSLNDARHRGPNPAVVGGSANSDGKSIGAINGTCMKRKP